MGRSFSYPWYPRDRYQPPDPDDDKALLRDQFWRLNHLYQVVNEQGKSTRFRMRPVQARFYWRMWYLNIILKSRQHGFTTFLALMALDNCLSIPNYHAHLIAHTREDAERLFEEKMRHPLRAYRAEHGEAFGRSAAATEDSVRVLRFANGSVLSCGQSMRSGTLQWLHISEHGKICARFADKAKEIRSGSLNTVHPGQCITIESTAEGRVGDFYEFVQTASKLRQQRQRLTKLDYRMHFFGWQDDPKNVLPPAGIVIQPEQQKYFADLEKQEGLKFTPGQKAWYVKKAAVQRDLMFQEYPTTPEEAFTGSTEGAYYGRLMIIARREGRIVPLLPFTPGVPVNTSWDIGKNDLMAIWLHQYLPHLGVHRWLGYYQNHGYGFSHYVGWLQQQQNNYELVWGTHYLPHDVAVSETTQDYGEDRRDHLLDLGLQDVVKVERVPHLADGLEAVRRVIPISQFNEERCAEGILCLENHSREWDERLENWKETPRKDKFIHGADAFRQLCQEYYPETAYRSRRAKGDRNWRTV